ncbi:MAG: hydroxylase [Planctomycetota bacterium]
MHPQYLEIVTPEVDATLTSLEKTHGITFGDSQADMGGARTAEIPGGGMIGVRAPMHAAENSVVRPYLLVEDIESAVANAVEAGAEVAMPPTPMEGRGTFAIYFLGGIEHGLWQL